MMNDRQNRGLAIAADSTVTRKQNIWTVPSQSSSKHYRVNLDAQTCTCPDFEDSRRTCKHIYAVEFTLQRESGRQLPEPEKIVKPTYRQAWREYNLSQTRERAYFVELLYQLCSLVEEPEKPKGKGRPPAPLADLVFSACMKTYSCMSGRRNQSDLDEAFRRGYLSRPVRYNTLFKYLELEVMTPYLQQLITESSLAVKSVEVDFALDSSGFGTCQYTRWFDVKYGNTEDWHDWIKLHVMTGVKTNIIVSCEVSRRYANDSPFFKPLVERAAQHFNLREVSADKGYDSFRNRTLTLVKGAIPYIPFREGEKNKPNSSNKGELWRRMYHLYKYNSEVFNSHYHKRSNAESTFQMIKARFGERLRSKTERAQINEALLKVLCHNICVVIQSMHELGVEAEFIGKDAACLQNPVI
jgi:transposase